MVKRHLTTLPCAGNNLRHDAGEFDVCVRTPQGRMVTARATSRRKQRDPAESVPPQSQPRDDAQTADAAAGAGAGANGGGGSNKHREPSAPARPPRLRVPGARSLPRASLPSSTKSVPGRAKQRWRVLRRAVSSRKPKGKNGAESADESGSQTPVRHTASHRERHKLAASVRTKNAG